MNTHGTTEFSENVAVFVVDAQDSDAYWREACERFVDRVVMPFSGTFFCFGGPPSSELYDQIVRTSDCVANHMMIRLRDRDDLETFVVAGGEGESGVPALERVITHTT